MLTVIMLLLTIATRPAHLPAVRFVIWSSALVVFFLTFLPVSANRDKTMIAQLVTRNLRNSLYWRYLMIERFSVSAEEASSGRSYIFSSGLPCLRCYVFGD